MILWGPRSKIKVTDQSSRSSDKKKYIRLRMHTTGWRIHCTVWLPKRANNAYTIYVKRLIVCVALCAKWSMRPWVSAFVNGESVHNSICPVCTDTQATILKVAQTVTTKSASTDWVIRFCIPFDTKWVISETFFPTNLLTWHWRNGTEPDATGVDKGGGRGPSPPPQLPSRKDFFC